MVFEIPRVIIDGPDQMWQASRLRARVYAGGAGHMAVHEWLLVMANGLVGELLLD